MINYRGRLGHCPCDTDPGAELPDPDPAAPGGRSASMAEVYEFGGVGRKP